MWLPIGRLKEKLAAKSRKARVKMLLEKGKFDSLLAEELFEDGRALGSGLGGEVRVVSIEGQEYALKETIYQEGTQEEDFARNDVKFGCKLDHHLVLKYLASHTQDAGVDAKTGKKQIRTRILQPLAEMDLHDALNDGHFHEPCTWPNLCKILRVFMKLVQAVEYMHSQNVVHLDLKHANVLVRNAATADPDVLLCDFGFCIQMKGPHAEHELASACGTDGYYAPEVVPGIWSLHRQRVSTACLKSDIYALGVMLWEMITAKQVMKKVTQPDGTRVMERDAKFPNLSGAPWSTPMSVRPGGFRVLHQLDWLIRKMTRDDHISRPSATQVIIELQEILQTPTMDTLCHPDENHYATLRPPSPILVAPSTPEKPVPTLALDSINLYSPVTVDVRNSPITTDPQSSPITAEACSGFIGNGSPLVVPSYPPSEPVTPITSTDHDATDELLSPNPSSPPHETFPIMATLFGETVKGSKDHTPETPPNKTNSSPRIAARRTHHSSPNRVDPNGFVSPRIKASTLWSRLTGGSGSSAASSQRTPPCSGSEVSPSPACSHGERSGLPTPPSQQRDGVTAG